VVIVVPSRLCVWKKETSHWELHTTVPIRYWVSISINHKFYNVPRSQEPQPMQQSYYPKIKKVIIIGEEYCIWSCILWEKKNTFLTYPLLKKLTRPNPLEKGFWNFDCTIVYCCF
jgi:hypothetical protein